MTSQDRLDTAHAHGRNVAQQEILFELDKRFPL